MNASVKTTERMCRVLSSAMLLACAWVASSAFAEEPVRTETVKFQDLNVDTPAGVKALYDRIHSAAHRVCSQSDPLLWSAASACARKAESQAVAKVGLPQLTAYYRMKTGDRTQPLSATR
jgi:UrcA family protein